MPTREARASQADELAIMQAINHNAAKFYRNQVSRLQHNSCFTTGVCDTFIKGE